MGLKPVSICIPLFPTPPTYKGNVIYLVLFSGRVQFFHYYFHRHSHTSTQPLFRENSAIFQRVTRAWPLFSLLVKIYVASLFNLISLKTNGGQQGFWTSQCQENIYHMIAHMPQMQTQPAHYAGSSHA